MSTVPDATARAVDPTKPIANAQLYMVEGHCATRHRPQRWTWPHGKHLGDDRGAPSDSALDLVNVESAPDAGEFDLDGMMRLHEAACKGSPNDHEEALWRFFLAARNAIPLLPAEFARREAEARRAALEEAVQAADVWSDDATQWHLGPADAIRALLDKGPTP